MLFATTSAVGHRVLIQAPGGFAYANRSAAGKPPLVLEASTAVSDSRFAAGPASPTITLHVRGGSDLG